MKPKMKENLINYKEQAYYRDSCIDIIPIEIFHIGGLDDITYRPLISRKSAKFYEEMGFRNKSVRPWILVEKKWGSSCFQIWEASMACCRVG